MPLPVDSAEERKARFPYPHGSLERDLEDTIAPPAPQCSACVSSAQPAPKNSDNRIKIATFLVLVIGVCTGAAVWASSEHLDIKDWAAERDHMAKEEVKEIVEKHYVPSDKFTEVKTEQKHIKEKVDDIDDKVDEIHDLLIGGRRPGRGHEREHNTSRNSPDSN